MQKQAVLPGFESAMQGLGAIKKEKQTKIEDKLAQALVEATDAHPEHAWSGRVLKSGHIELEVKIKA